MRCPCLFVGTPRCAVIFLTMSLNLGFIGLSFVNIAIISMRSSTDTPSQGQDYRMATAHLHKPVRQLHGFSLYFAEDIAIIVIDRGENRLNPEFLQAFNALLDDVERNESCKGLITTGVGKFYGNGLDLKLLATLPPDELAAFFLKLHTTLRRLLIFPLPTVAALNGHAYAGGAVLAFVHDLRVMKIEKGWLCFNEVFIERRFGEFNMASMQAKIGPGQNLSDSLVLGKHYTAEEALKTGLVSAISLGNLLISESVRQLKAIMGKTGYPRESLANMKTDVFKTALEKFDIEVAKFPQSKM